MISEWNNSSQAIAPKKLKTLYKVNTKASLVRIATCIICWGVALLAYINHTFTRPHIIGISITNVFIICINFPALYVLRHIKTQGGYKRFTILFNTIEVIGYTTVIYFCGDIEVPLTPMMYIGLISYVGFIAPRRYAYTITTLCVFCYIVMFGLVIVGVLPHLSLNPGYNIALKDKIFLLIILIPFLYVNAYFSDNTAYFLRRKQEDLRKHNAEIALVNAQLENANQNLKHEIEERMRIEHEKEKLTHQLQHAQKMEAIGMLADGVAQDLNDILSGIITYPDLLLSQIPTDSPLITPLKTIKETGIKAAAISQDLSILARYGEIPKQTLDLNMIITDYINNDTYRQLTSHDRKIETDIYLEEYLPNFVGASDYLTTVISNIIQNAVEAMPAGGKLVIKTGQRFLETPVGNHEDVKAGNYIFFQISDTGIGIGPADCARFFEPFYIQKKMGRGGSGLGMAVVWGTISEHNGYIDLQSDIGKGTTFTIYLPAVLT